MSYVHEVRLELLRPGPLHGQLLSRLTPYVAVCAGYEAATIHLPLEHWELLNILSGLDYRLPVSRRNEQLRALAHAMGAVLAAVPSLAAALGGKPGSLVHLRLITGGSELAMLPLEAAGATNPLPGPGHHLLVQPDCRVVLTREVRRSPQVGVDWARPPKVLVVAAAPPPHPPVPLRAHLLALYQALLPFDFCDSGDDRAGQAMDGMLTVLPCATLEEVRAACAAADPPFTHVHILAHGVAYKELGQRRYGVAFHRGQDKRDIVSGERLAVALRPQRSGDRGLADPIMVTLLSCEGGGIGNVVLPLGSIAQELHEAGIPWVLASQLPLSMAGSALLAEYLYPDLFLGEDPRLVLHEARRRLFAALPNRHDWASLVVYAALPPDFSEQIRAAQRQQAHTALSVLFNRIDKDRRQGLLSDSSRATYDEQCRTYQQLIARTLPTVRSEATAFAQAQVRDLLGSAERNRAFLLVLPCATTPAPSGPSLAALQRFRAHLEQARLHYHEAIALWPHHVWCQLHLLSLRVLLGEQISTLEWVTVYQAAIRQILSDKPLEQAWGHAALVEVHLLARASPKPDRLFEDLVYQQQHSCEPGHRDGEPQTQWQWAQNHVTKLTAATDQDSDVLRKLRRQLRRYHDAVKQRFWTPNEDFTKACADLAKSLQPTPDADVARQAR